MSAMVPAAVVLPLLLALALAPRRLRHAALVLAPWAAAPALGLALLAPAMAAELPWIVFGTRLALGGSERLLLGVTAALWLAAGIYGRAYLAGDRRQARYTAFFLAAMSGNLGLVVAQDLASFYVLFALMSFASYGLVVHAGDDSAHRAGRIYVILVVLGELLLFSGFVLLAAQPERAGLAALGPLRAPAEGWAFPLLALGFGVKAGALPLHVWLPLAHPVAPTPASAVLSGAMIKAGLVGWLRFLPIGAGGLEAWALIFVALGLAAAFYGAVAGVSQSDAKAVLAYSSISQMGLVTVAAGATVLAPEAALPAALAYAAHHAIAKGSLFLGVGLAHAARGGRQRSVLLVGLLFLSATLAGAPGTSGAAVKLMLKDAVSVLPPNWINHVLTLLPLAAIGTTLLMARFLWLVWPHGEQTQPARWPMLGPWLGLLAAAVTAPAWLPGWDRGYAGTLVSKDLFPALGPILAGIGLAALALGPARALVTRLPRLPQGDLVVVFEAAWRTLAAAGRRLGDAAARRPAHLWLPEGFMCGASALEHAERGLTGGPIAATLLVMLALALLGVLLAAG
jgi:formate hydrogenlyase subunit 3/multisubunit Na+/H+ antiporter MnhD subunit